MFLDFINIFYWNKIHYLKSFFMGKFIKLLIFTVKTFYQINKIMQTQRQKFDIYSSEKVLIFIKIKILITYEQKKKTLIWLNGGCCLHIRNMRLFLKTLINSLSRQVYFVFCLVLDLMTNCFIQKFFFMNAYAGVIQY